MRNFFISTLAVASLAGCGQTFNRPPAPVGGHYACRLGNGHADSRIFRTVTIMPDDQADSIEAAVDTIPTQTLNRMPGDNGSLYANNMFAWRPEKHAGILTDVGNIQTYACQMLGRYAWAATRPPLQS